MLVALAGMGWTPVKSSVGNEMKLPPPATALSAPAIGADGAEQDGLVKVQKEIRLPESVVAAGENFYHGLRRLGSKQRRAWLANWRLLFLMACEPARN